METVIAAAVVISALALLAQAFMVYGMFRTVKSVSSQIDTFLPKAESLIAKTQSAVVENHAQIREVTARAMSLLDVTHKQVTRVDDALGEAAVRAKSQLERLELVLDDTVGRVHRTVVQINDTVMRPVKELHGVTAGFRAALQHLARGTRPSVAEVTADEEMFI